MQLGAYEELVQFQRTRLYNFLSTTQKSVRIPEGDRVRRLQPRPDPKVCDPDPADAAIPVTVQYNTLRSKAGKHTATGVEQVRDQGDRRREWLL